MLSILETILDDFLVVANLAHCPISRQEIIHDPWTMPHAEKNKPTGYKAVYIYSLANEQTLKVGKISENSTPRYRHEHYKVFRNKQGELEGSTLANSIAKHQDSWALLNIASQLSDGEIGDWIRQNTDRDNLLISEAKSDFLVNLLEAFLHCRLEPIFEGRASDKGRKQSERLYSGEL